MIGYNNMFRDGDNNIAWREKHERKEPETLNMGSLYNIGFHEQLTNY